MMIALRECYNVEFKSIEASLEEVVGKEDDDDEDENKRSVELLLQRTLNTSLFEAATVPFLKD